MAELVASKSRGEPTLPITQRRLARPLLNAIDLAGVIVPSVIATVALIEGKLLLTFVLVGVGLGFYFRLLGRRQQRLALPYNTPAWGYVAALLLATTEIGLFAGGALVTTRENPMGLHVADWVLIAVAVAVLFVLHLQLLRMVLRRQRATVRL